jgi:hypothetical protein
MDELNMVRDLLAPPPPPSSEVTARAGQRLAEHIGQPPRPASSHWPGRWSRRAWWTAGLTGVAAAGLAGALAATTVLSGSVPARQGGFAGSRPAYSGGGHPSSGNAGSASGLVTSERPFGTLTGQPAGPYLTALAARVAQVPAGTGRYWCTISTDGQLDPIGPGGHELTPSGQGERPSPVSDYRYSIITRNTAEDCFAISGSTSSNAGGYTQHLGAKPATAADATAWRRDGSPAWYAWYQDGYLIQAQPGPRQRTGGKPGEVQWGSGAGLPASPARLRQALLADYSAPVPIPGGPRPIGGPDEYLFMQAGVLLLDPLPPTVRAATYQVLATILGVHMKTGVTDPADRPGIALWMGSDPSYVIVVDPVNGLRLADEWLATKPDGVYAAGTMTQYQTWQYPGWSNELPTASSAR